MGVLQSAWLKGRGGFLEDHLDAVHGASARVQVPHFCTLHTLGLYFTSISFNLTYVTSILCTSHTLELICCIQSVFDGFWLMR